MTLTATKELTTEQTSKKEFDKRATRFDRVDQRVDSQVALDELFEPKRDVSEMTVADLVRAAQTGDRAASGELYELSLIHI